MEWVETTGQSIEEAQAKALDLLNVDGSDAEIEVLEDVKKGLFGRVKSDARVRARIRPKAPAPKDDRRNRRGSSNKSRNEGAGRSRGNQKRSGGGNRSGGRSDGGGSSGGGSNSGGSDKGSSGGGSNSGGSEKGSSSGRSNSGGSDKGANSGGSNRGAKNDGSRGGGRDGGGRDGGGRDGGNRSRQGATAAAAVGAAGAVAATSGDKNSGDQNSGDQNSGSRNTNDGSGRSDQSHRSESGSGKSKSNNGQPRGGRNREESTVDEEFSVADQQQIMQDFVGGVAAVFDSGSTTEVVDLGDDTLEAQVSGEDLGLLVGPSGATLAALEELTRTALQRSAGGRRYHRIHVDVDEYKSRRRAALGAFAVTIADQVKDSGERKALESMNAADRKVVHDALTDIEGVVTLSEGEDPRRYVVIAPE